MTEWTLIRKTRCSSTNDTAKNLPPYTAVSACHQTKGRGRMGRKWQDGKGNLMVSLVLPKPVKNAELYTFLISLAVARSLEKLSAKIKWPNDILIDGKKVCGILLEVFQDKLIIGIGVNIQSCPSTDVMYPVACLKDFHFDITYKRLLKSILQNLDSVIQCYQKKGFKTVRHEWLQFACGLEKPISVNLPSQKMTGIFKGITDTGALILQTTDGNLHEITAGDVFLI